jgi:hypothetical protein
VHVGFGDALGLHEGLGDGLGLHDGDGLGLHDGDGLVLHDGEALGLHDGDGRGLPDGDGLVLHEGFGDGLGLCDGVGEGLGFLPRIVTFIGMAWVSPLPTTVTVSTPLYVPDSVSLGTTRPTETLRDVPGSRRPAVVSLAKATLWMKGEIAPRTLKKT